MIKAESRYPLTIGQAPDGWVGVHGAAYIDSLRVTTGAFAGLFEKLYRIAEAGRIEPYFMFAAMVLAPGQFTATLIREACEVAIDQLVVGPHQTNTTYTKNTQVRSTAGRVFTVNNASGTTGGTEPVAGFAAATLASPFVSDSGITWELVPERVGDADPTPMEMPASWQWYIVGVDGDLFRRKRPDSNDAYAAVLISACLAAGVDDTWLNTATGHGGLTRMEVLALLGQHNISDDITDNLSMTFQAATNPAGQPYDIRWLADNCEAYRGMKALADLHGIVGETVEEAAADAVAATLKTGILALWDSSVGRFRAYYGETEHLTGSGDKYFVDRMRFHLWPFLQGVLSTNAEIVAYADTVMGYTVQSTPGLFTLPMDGFAMGEWYLAATMMNVPRAADCLAWRVTSRPTSGVTVCDAAVCLEALS